MTIITSMIMLINDGYSTNKVEKSLQKVLQNFFDSLRKILRLFSIMHFIEHAFHVQCQKNC